MPLCPPFRSPVSRLRFQSFALFCIFFFSACGDKAQPSSSGPPPVEEIALPAKDIKLSTAPGLKAASGDAPLADLMAKSEAKADENWSSEAFNSSAGTQLKLFAKALNHSPLETPVDLAAPSFSSTSLVPAGEIVFNQDSVKVSRVSAEGIPSATMDFPSAFAELWKTLNPDDSATVRAKFKIVRVELADAAATTEVYFQAFSQSTKEALQLTAEWTCQWVVPSRDVDPLLAGITLTGSEKVTREGAADAAFTDATAFVFDGVESFDKQLVFGADYWYGNRDVAFGIHQGNQGLAIGDADGDGLDDLFICQPSGMPSRLYLRKENGQLKDVTAESGLNWLDAARSALFADLDNDGDQDLAVSLGYSLALFQNNGSASFQLIATV